MRLKQLLLLSTAVASSSALATQKLPSVISGLVSISKSDRSV